MRIVVSALAAVLLSIFASSQADTESYEHAAASRDGIGKLYFGREISQVMGHLGAGWLERPERERQERTDLLLQALPLKSTDVVADIGAGTGYFSLPIAQRVDEGQVLAVDIQQEMLDIVSKRAEDANLDNITTVLSTPEDPTLPPAAVDLVLLVDAYHEFSHPREMMLGVARGLRPGGLLALVEYRGEDPEVPIKPLHKMTQKQARLEMEAVGFEWVRTEDVLPQQHLMIFRKPQ